MKANEPTESEKYVAANYVLVHREITEFLLFTGYVLHSLNSEEHAEEDTETRLKVVEEFATVYNAIAASYLRYIGKPPQSLYKDDREYCMAVVKEIRDKINTGGVCSYIADMEKLIAERRSMCDTVIVKEISRAESAEYRNRN